MQYESRQSGSALQLKLHMLFGPITLTALVFEVFLALVGIKAKLTDAT